jgi:hypothetical protein
VTRELHKVDLRLVGAFFVMYAMACQISPGKQSTRNENAIADFARAHNNSSQVERDRRIRGGSIQTSMHAKRHRLDCMILRSGWLTDLQA